MLSLSEIKNRLNPLFLERLSQQFDALTVDNILRGFAEDHFPVIRINTLKVGTQEIMRQLKELNIRFERIPFLNDSLIIQNRNEKDFEKLEMYINGKIYFQGISSQLPALILNPSPGEKVLDMAAAPGSKTAQMGIYMQNKGEILANEIDQIRYERLKYNLNKQGITLAKTRLGNGIEIGAQMPGYFDKVLLDAPCSAEGRISINNPRTYKFWSEKNIRNNKKLQSALFTSAVKALRPGGVLVYSTCTLAPEENEMMVEWALAKFPQLKLEKINLDFKYRLPVLKSFPAIKAMPSKISEGFFVAKFISK